MKGNFERVFANLLSFNRFISHKHIFNVNQHVPITYFPFIPGVGGSQSISFALKPFVNITLHWFIPFRANILFLLFCMYSWYSAFRQRLSGSLPVISEVGLEYVYFLLCHWTMIMMGLNDGRLFAPAQYSSSGGGGGAQLGGPWACVMRLRMLLWRRMQDCLY